jgi:hypothetical protein
MKIMPNKERECSFSNKYILVRTIICNSMGCIDIINWYSAAVSIGEQLWEYDLTKPKHVAIECDFNGILK